MKCPNCGYCMAPQGELFTESAASILGKKGGAATSAAKAAAARANGSKGGRPRNSVKFAVPPGQKEKPSKLAKSADLIALEEQIDRLRKTKAHDERLASLKEAVITAKLKRKKG